MSRKKHSSGKKKRQQADRSKQSEESMTASKMGGPETPAFVPGAAPKVDHHDLLGCPCAHGALLPTGNVSPHLALAIVDMMDALEESCLFYIQHRAFLPPSELVLDFLERTAGLIDETFVSIAYGLAADFVLEGSSIRALAMLHLARLSQYWTEHGRPRLTRIMLVSRTPEWLTALFDETQRWVDSETNLVIDLKSSIPCDCLDEALTRRTETKEQEGKCRHEPETPSRDHERRVRQGYAVDDFTIFARDVVDFRGFDNYFAFLSEYSELLDRHFVAVAYGRATREVLRDDFLVAAHIANMAMLCEERLRLSREEYWKAWQAFGIPSKAPRWFKKWSIQECKNIIDELELISFLATKVPCVCLNRLLRQDTDFETSCDVCGKTYPVSKLFTCSRCHRGHFCSQECQRKDWPKHKIECRKVKKCEDLNELD